MDPIHIASPSSVNLDASYPSPKRKRAQEFHCLNGFNGNEKIRSIHTSANFIKTSTTYSENIRNQLSAIESWMIDAQLSTSQIEEIRAKIADIVGGNESEEKKMAELGCLFYYIQTGESRIYSAYLETFKMSLLCHLKQIKKAHKENCKSHLSNLFPSGKTHYFYSQIAELIFSQAGTLNLGGCFAALEILKSPLSRFITEENAQQMRNFLIRLIERNELQTLLLKPLKVHPRCKKIVYLDLKLNADTPLAQVHVQRFLLQTFFSSNGQISGEGNCYTVAPLLNCLRQNPETLLTLVREVLETGAFKFEEIQIDASFFIDFTQIYEQDFQHVVNDQELRKIEVLEKAKKMFPCISLAPDNSQPQSLTLEKWLERQFGNHTQAVKEFILSYKLNYLQHLIFGMLQWIVLNSSQYIEDKFSPRLNLAMSIGSYFFHSIGKTADQMSPTVFGFFEHMIKRFGLVESKNLYYTVEGDRIFFPFQKQGFRLLVDVDSASAQDVKKGRQYDGDLAKYSCCTQGRSLYFCHKKGDLQPVEKISEFVSIMRELFEEFLAKYPDSSEDIVTFKNYLASEKCKQDIAQCIAVANFGYANISAQEYYFSDSFFLLQNGANAIHLLFSEKLKEKFEVQEFSSKDEKEFFINVCNRLASFYRSGITQTPEAFTLASSPNHIFNLCPSKISHFLYESPSKKIEEYLEKNKAVLETLIDDEEKKKILDEALKGKAAYVFNKIPKGPVAIRLFRKQVYFRLDTSLHETFDTAFETHLRQIDLKKIRLQLVKLLETLKISETANREALIEKALENAPSYILPYELAKRLQKTLYKNSCGFLSIAQLEQKIEEMTHVPNSIQMGNLNWVSNLSEDQRFTNLALRYQFTKERLIFVRYVEGIETVLDPQVVQPMLATMKLFLRKA